MQIATICARLRRSGPPSTPRCGPDACRYCYGLGYRDTEGPPLSGTRKCKVQSEDYPEVLTMSAVGQLPGLNIISILAQAPADLINLSVRQIGELNAVMGMGVQQ